MFSNCFIMCSLGLPHLAFLKHSTYTFKHKHCNLQIDLFLMSYCLMICFFVNINLPRIQLKIISMYFLILDLQQKNCLWFQTKCIAKLENAFTCHRLNACFPCQNFCNPIFFKFKLWKPLGSWVITVSFGELCHFLENFAQVLWFL